MLQKLVLLSGVRQYQSSQFKDNKLLFEDLKLYSNPELYIQEQAMLGTDTGRVNKWEKTNSEFKQHSESAAKTGKPQLSPRMQKAIKDCHAMRTNPDPNIKYISVDQAEKPPQPVQSPQPARSQVDDDEFVG